MRSAHFSVRCFFLDVAGRSTHRASSMSLVIKKICTSRQQRGSSELGLKAAQPSPSFIRSSTTSGLWIPGNSVSQNQSGRVTFSPSTQQWLVGNTAPCPTWNKKDFHRCPKIAGHSKEMSMAPLRVLVCSGYGSSRNTNAGGRPTSCRCPSMDRSRRPFGITTVAGRTCKKVSWASPRHALQENGGLADQWYVDDGDILCHPILVPSYLQKFDGANDSIGAERNPQKTEVIYCVKELDAASPGWKIDEVRLLASASTVAAGSNTLRVAMGPRQVIADQLLAKADVTRAMRERVQPCQDARTDLALLRESLGVSRINHLLRVHGHTMLQVKRAAEICGGVGHRSLERLFPGFTEDSSETATLYAGRSGIG